VFGLGAGLMFGFSYWYLLFGLWAGIPTAIVAERQRGYFQWRLEEAVAELSEGSSELLAEVLEEIFLVADGTDTIINWQPPALEDMISRIGEPLGSATSAHM